MSESVQRRLELISEEIEELKRTSMCRREEYVNIAKNYFNYENKLNSTEKTAATFKEYIKYVVTVVQLIQVRRVSKEIAEKKHKLKYRMLNRVKNLYEMAVTYFPNDVDLYLDFFKFCKDMHYVDASTSICNSMIKNHQKNPLVWLVAARWYFHEKKDPPYALRLLQQALKIHEDNLEIYKECLLYEMRSVTVNIKFECENDQLNDKFKAYADAMFKDVTRREFFTDLLAWMETYPITLPLQKAIIEHLLDAHKDDELMWDFLAQRERRGIHYSEEGIVTSVKQTEALDHCINMYEQGIKWTSGKNCHNMWHLYIGCMVDMKNEGSLSGEMVKSTLIPFFNRAYTWASISEKGYICWIKTMDDEKAIGVAQMANDKLPSSVDLWKLRMQLEMTKGIMDDINAAFEKGLKALGERSGPLWLLYLGHLVLTSNDGEVEKCYLKGLECNAEVANLLKPHYIQWLSLDKSVKKLISEYERLAKSTPYCKEMYNAMCRIGKTLGGRYLSYEFLEKCHKQAIEQFGHEDIDPWINLVNFYLDCKVNDPRSKENINEVFKLAKKRLQDIEFLQFEHKYDLIIKDMQERSELAAQSA